MASAYERRQQRERAQAERQMKNLMRRLHRRLKRAWPEHEHELGLSETWTRVCMSSLPNNDGDDSYGPTITIEPSYGDYHFHRPNAPSRIKVSAGYNEALRGSYPIKKDDGDWSFNEDRLVERIANFVHDKVAGLDVQTKLNNEATAAYDEAELVLKRAGYVCHRKDEREYQGRLTIESYWSAPGVELTPEEEWFYTSGAGRFSISSGAGRVQVEASHQRLSVWPDEVATAFEVLEDFRTRSEKLGQDREEEEEE